MSTINFNKYIKNNQVLDLSGKWGIFCNSEYEERVKDLGEFIKNNPNITTLNLSKSYIKVDSLHSLVDSINNSNITTLDISSNNVGLEGVEAIAKMKLHNLDISFNNVGLEGVEAISKMKLTSLNISSNNLGPKGAEAISKIPNLTILNISRNDIGLEGVEAIAKTNLNSLNISDNNIGPKGAEAIAKMKLNSLNISCNNLGPKGAEALSKTNLTSLNISYNNLGPEWAKYIPEMPNLNSLDISGNNIGPDGAKYIPEMPNLNSLNISYNNLGPEWAKYIPKIPNLTSLNILDNKLGPDGAKYIPQLPNLNSLNISGNNLGPEGAKYIPQTPNLTSLDISDNNIGPEGAKYIPEMPNLNSLNISGNNLGPEWAKYISQLPNLTSLNISGNNISPDGVKYLSELPNLNSLDISGNQLGPKEAEELGKLTNCSFEGFGPEKVFCSLAQQKNRNPNITPEEIQNDVFALVRGRNDEWVEYILNNDYPVLISSPDPHRIPIGHFYPDSPRMQQLLFHKGLIPMPAPGSDQRGSIGNVIQHREGVHLTEVVDPINFTVAELIEFYGQDEKQVSAAVKSFQNKLAGFNPNSLKVSLLSLTESGKKITMRTAQDQNPLPLDDKSFVKKTINTASERLQTQYLNDNNDYATTAYQYEYENVKMGKKDKTITIPIMIGLVTRLIDTIEIPLQDKQALLVTLCEKNPELLVNKLSMIQEKLGQEVTLEKLGNRQEVYKLLANTDSKTIEDMFSNISGLNLEDTWREQRYFDLAETIVMAANTHAKNLSTCPPGVITALVTRAKAIDGELDNHYANSLAGQAKEVINQKEITKNSMTLTEFDNKLVEELYFSVNNQNNPDLLETLFEGSWIAKIDNPPEITLEEQKIIASLNQSFNKLQPEYLPKTRVIPYLEEYRIIVAAVGTSSSMALLAAKYAAEQQPSNAVKDAQHPSNKLVNTISAADAQEAKSLLANVLAPPSTSGVASNSRLENTEAVGQQHRRNSAPSSSRNI